MSYFTKFLPQEGEGNGYFFDKERKEVIYQMNPEPEENLQRVQLFLCTNDIKFNEECYVDVVDGWQGDGSFKLGYPIKHFFGINALPWEKAFKIVGEVSSEAAGWYVSEGMKYEEDQVKLFGFLTGPGWMVPGITNPEEFVRNNHDAKIICQIKGPCGHFH